MSDICKILHLKNTSTSLKTADEVKEGTKSKLPQYEKYVYDEAETSAILHFNKDNRFKITE